MADPRRARMYFREFSLENVRSAMGVNFHVEEYSPHLLVAELDMDSFSALQRENKHIRLPNIPTGEMKYLRIHEDDPRLYASVDIFGYPLYPQGIHVTPFSEAIQMGVYKLRTSTMKTGMHRVEFIHYNPFGDEEAQRVDPVIDTFDSFDFYLRQGSRPVIFTAPKTEARKQSIMSGQTS